MFAVHYHKQTGAVRQWGTDDGAIESVFGPDYAIALFDEWQNIDPLRQRIDVKSLAIVRRTRKEIGKVMRLDVENAIRAELVATIVHVVPIPDEPMPIEQREAWRDYRQALRDLSGSVEDILADWPPRPDGTDAAKRLRDQLGD